MKKLLALTLSALLTLGILTACGESSSSGASSSNTSSLSNNSKQLSSKELDKLAELVYKCADSYNSKLIADGEAGLSNKKNDTIVFQIGKTDYDDEKKEHIAKEVAQKTTDEQKGYWAEITIDLNDIHCVRISSDEGITQTLGIHPIQTPVTTTTTATSNDSSVPDSSSIPDKDVEFMEKVKDAMNGAKAKVKAFDFDESKIQRPLYSIDAECIITQYNETTTMTCGFNKDKMCTLTSMTVRYKDGVEWISEYYTDKNYSSMKPDSEIKKINEKNLKKFITAAACMDSENYNDKVIDSFTSEFIKQIYNNNVTEIKYKNYIYTISYAKNNLVFALVVTRLDTYNSSMDYANKPHFSGYEFAG